MKRIKIHPTCVLVFFLPVFGIITLHQTLILWWLAILHESAHIFSYRLCGCGIKSVTVLPFGLCSIPKNTLSVSPKNEIFCAAAGPIVNLFLALVILALPLPPESEIARYALYCNLALFTLNLLPILPLDGGRILYYVTSLKYCIPTCETICRRVATILLILMLYPVCATLFVDYNPSLALIWGYLTTYTFFQRGSI